MAKKHTRKEHISYRRKREEAIREQNRTHLTAGQKKQVAIAVAAAVLALLLFFGFALPALKGAVITWFGTPMFVKNGDGSMLGKIGNYYYDLGQWDYELEGFTYVPDYMVARDKYRFEAYYTNDAEDSKVYSVYVGVVPEMTVQEMYDKVTPWVTEASELKDYEDAQAPAKYFVTRSHFGEEQGTAQLSVVMYLETSHNALLHISVNTDTIPETELPEADELLAVVPQVLSNLTVK